MPFPRSARLLSFLLCAMPALAHPGHDSEPAADLVAVGRDMADKAAAFLAALTPEQSARARFEFADAERENWHFVPRSRQGVSLGELSAEQRAAARALLASALSARGLLKVDAIIALEPVLARLENNPRVRDPGKFYLTVFGSPSASAPWGWRFEGHHVSFNFTLKNGQPASVTPSFLGANPAELRAPADAAASPDARPLAREEDLARVLAVALQDSGQPVLFSDKPPREILTAADRRLRQLDPVGVKAADMTSAQRDALLSLISEYAERHRPELAARDLARARAQLDQLRFGWAGSLVRGEAYYYRVQGPDFLIEAANVQNRANHIHTVWRDRANDFGRDLLGDHQREHDTSAQDH